MAYILAGNSVKKQEARESYGNALRTGWWDWLASVLPGTKSVGSQVQYLAFSPGQIFGAASPRTLSRYENPLA